MKWKFFLTNRCNTNNKTTRLTLCYRTTLPNVSFWEELSRKTLYQPIAKQSEEVFDTIRTIMEAESMPIYSIVRQWNYIEKITEYNQGRQNYQAFNDARSCLL